ncbi:MAG: AAA family ATPase [Pseudomonadota bacterium]
MAMVAGTLVEPSGKLIAFMGLPCSGKSTVAKCLAPLMGATVYHEPAPEVWPAEMVNDRDVVCATSMTWARAMRLPQLYLAVADRANGAVAIVDSYVDKLLLLYIKHPSMGGVLPFEDPYRHVIRQMAELDFEHLPDADIVVFMKVSRRAWSAFQKGQGRPAFDARFQESFDVQKTMLAGTRYWADRVGASLIVHEQEDVSSPSMAAEAILKVLTRSEGAVDDA